MGVHDVSLDPVLRLLRLSNLLAVADSDIDYFLALSRIFFSAPG